MIKHVRWNGCGLGAGSTFGKCMSIEALYSRTSTPDDSEMEEPRRTLKKKKMKKKKTRGAGQGFFADGSIGLAWVLISPVDASFSLSLFSDSIR